MVERGKNFQKYSFYKLNVLLLRICFGIDGFGLRQRVFANMTAVCCDGRIA